MVELIKKPYQVYSKYGLHHLITAVENSIKEKQSVAKFWYLNKKLNNRKETILIVPRAGTVDQDALSLLLQAGEIDKKVKIHIAVPSLENIQDIVDLLENRADELNYRIVETHSKEFRRALAESSYIVIKSDNYITEYRPFCENKLVTRIYHGVTLKGKDKVSPNIAKDSMDVRIVDPITDESINVRSVESDFQKYLSYGKGNYKNITKFKKFGYPRFDRLKQLATGNVEPLLSDNAESILNDNNYTQILYAPTHKEGVYDTTLFPLEGFDYDELITKLQENNIRLFIRMHPSEEQKGIHQKYINNDTIYYAGYDFSSSNIEMLPYMDGLITDYSSIYIDYLYFDRPILFFKDKHEQFLQNPGISVDYEMYFPGPKITKFCTFINYLLRIQSGNMDDEYKYERNLVRDVILQPDEKLFCEKLLEYQNHNNS